MGQDSGLGCLALHDFIYYVRNTKSFSRACRRHTQRVAVLAKRLEAAFDELFLTWT